MRTGILEWQRGGSVEWRMLEYRNAGAGGGRLHGKGVGSGFIIWTILDLVCRFEKQLK